MEECLAAMTRWLLNRISIFCVISIAAVFGTTVPLNGESNKIAEEIWNFTKSCPKKRIAHVIWNAQWDKHKFVNIFKVFLPENARINSVDSNSGPDEETHQVRVAFRYMGRNWVYECSAVSIAPRLHVSLKSIVLYFLDVHTSRKFKVAGWESKYLF